MKGWILYKRNRLELGAVDHGVNRLLEEAPSLGISLEVYRPEQFELIAAQNRQSGLFLNGTPVPPPDFVLPRLGAETGDFAMALIHHLEGLQVRVFNGSRGIGLSGNKMRMCQILARNALPIPTTLLVQFPLPWALVREQIGFPLIIKRITGAKGIGIHLCETEGAFRDIMELLTIPGSSSGLIVQQFVRESYGRDVRVFMVGNEPVGCMLRTAKEGFKANFSLGGTVAPMPLTEEITTLAKKASQLAALDISGVDLLFGAEGFLVCEVNSSPGFNGMEQATGVNVARSILQHVRTTLESR